MNERLKTSRKGLVMEITIRQILLGVRLLIRLCLPATVFIGLCTGIFIAFIAFLPFLNNITRDVRFFGGAWLSLFIFYIIFGVAFIRFNARLIHNSFGSEELRVQRRMAALSGLPFYALCLLFLMTGIIFYSFYSDAPDVCASTVFISMVGFLGFGLVSFSYSILIRLLKPRQSSGNSGVQYSLQ